jgi:M6 family metalloprotease-like protein
MRRVVPALALVSVLVGCSMPTEPGTDPDIDRFPYVLSPQGVRVFGTSRILLIPAQFADGLPVPLTQAALRERFFGSPGLLTETYRLASGAGFTLRGDVVPWFKSSLTVAAARGPGVLTNSGEGDYVAEAILAAGETLDFGLYDNDGPDGKPNSGDDDGLVDGGVVVLNSEFNIYCNNGTGRGPHPHALTKWRINSAGALFNTRAPRAGGGFIAVGGYVVMSAVGCSTTGNITPTLAHELGHLLFGLPDLYQNFGASVTEPWTVRRWVLGCWELMAAGSGWGCGSGTPSYDGRVGSFGAWTRMTVGWVQPTVIPADRDASYDLFSLGHGGTVLRLPIRANEYLLLEYREPGPGDGLPPAAGVLVYHVADTLPAFPPTATKFSKVNLIEADDDDGLTRTELEGGNRGVAADAFGVTRTALRPGEHSRFTAIDGSPLPFEILEITLNPAQHKARLRVVPINP